MFSLISMQEFASNYLSLILLGVLTALSLFLLSFLKEEEDPGPWKPPVRRPLGAITGNMPSPTDLSLGDTKSPNEARSLDDGKERGAR